MTIVLIVVLILLIAQKEAAIPVSQTALYSISLMVVAGFTVINTGLSGLREWSSRRRDDRIVKERAAAVKLAEEQKKALEHTSETVDKVHTIVNSEKTRMMEDLTSARLLNLSMAQALLEANPKSESAKRAMELAKAMYERIAAATNSKISGDNKSSK
jgi:hypothetical protein